MTVERLILLFILGLNALALYVVYRRKGGSPLRVGPELSESIEPLRERLAILAHEIQNQSASLAAMSERLISRQESFAQAVESISRERFGELRSELLVAQAERERAEMERSALRDRELFETTSKLFAEARKEQSERLLQIDETLKQQLERLQRSNEARLDEMRKVVDEKLHETLEKRLSESFRSVSEHLEAVHRGLGEMKNLAADVGGLKRALTNVKNRGVLGEAQLGALLEQFLSPEQYLAHASVKRNSAERVEFAVRLPGTEEGSVVLLPIDAKFPIEDYQRLLDAYEHAEPEEAMKHAQALEQRILQEARSIRDKYINPPTTTDFALLFLPFEGLYAEVLRRPGLFQRIQREMRVTIVGPTTLTAFLNSLQVGFKTLAITKQSAEIHKTLARVKTEFERFGVAVAQAQKKIEEAGKKLGDVEHRRSIMMKRLTKVEALPENGAGSTNHLGEPSAHPEAVSLLEAPPTPIGDD